MTEEERTLQRGRQRKEIVQILRERRKSILQGISLYIAEPSEVSYKIDKPIDKQILIKRSIFFYVLHIFFLLIICAYFFMAKYVDNLLGKIGFCAGGLILSLVVMRKFIEDVKVVKAIMIYENGIDVDDTTIAWADISGIYITGQAWMSGNPVYILWFALKNGTYQEFNITSYPYDSIMNTIGHYIYMYNPMQEQDIEAQKARLTKKNTADYYTYKNGAYNINEN